MKKRIFILLAAPIIVVSLWWTVPDRAVTKLVETGSIKLADLGPAEACACVPAMSPALTDWRRCSIPAIEKAGLERGVVFPEPENRYPPRHRKSFPEGFAEAMKAAEQACGAFSDAKARANELNKQRRAAGYETYILVDHTDQLFSGKVIESRAHYAGKSEKS